MFIFFFSAVCKTNKDDGVQTTWVGVAWFVISSTRYSLRPSTRARWFIFENDARYKYLIYHLKHNITFIITIDQRFVPAVALLHNNSGHVLFRSEFIIILSWTALSRRCWLYRTFRTPGVTISIRSTRIMRTTIITQLLLYCDWRLSKQ